MQGSAHKLKSPTEKPHLSFGAQCIHTLKLPFFLKKNCLFTCCVESNHLELWVWGTSKGTISWMGGLMWACRTLATFFPPQFWKHPQIQMSRIHLCVDGPAPQ